LRLLMAGVRCEGTNIKYKGYAPDIIIPSNATEKAQPELEPIVTL